MTGVSARPMVVIAVGLTVRFAVVAVRSVVQVLAPAAMIQGFGEAVRVPEGHGVVVKFTVPAVYATPVWFRA